MDQRQKNIILITVLALLIGLTAFFGTWSPGGNVAFDEREFAVDDAQSITAIRLNKGSGDVRLTKGSEGWVVNEINQADPYLIELLLSVMERIRVNRMIAADSRNGILASIDSAGVQVDLFSGEEAVGSFQVGGEQGRQQTYFYSAQQDLLALVGIPGYNDYLAPIFLLDQGEWRNRIVFSSSWRSVKKLSVQFPEDPEKSFVIAYHRNFLEIEGLAGIDTTKMMDYIENYNQLRCEGYLEPEEYPQYVQLMEESQPILEIEVEDINPGRNNSLSLYPRLPGDPFYMGHLGGNEMALFNPSSVDALMVSRQGFMPQ